MYSRDETVNAVLKFYRTIIRHPYLENSALVRPPQGGWSSINVEGKNKTVLDLLRHLPYLHSENQYERLLVHWETVPIYYPDDQGREEIYSLPAYCIYLTRSVDREGTNLIIDTNEGTITEYSHTGSHITKICEDYEALPEAEKWRAHRTTPITELFNTWSQRYEKLVWMLVPNPIGQPTTGRFYSRAESNAEEEILQEAVMGPWHVQERKTRHDFRSEMDWEQHKARESNRKHVAVCPGIRIFGMGVLKAKSSIFLGCVQHVSPVWVDRPL
jgi:hypothetical protein